MLDSARGAARTILLDLPAGERLQDHEVRERAHLVVAAGEVEIEAGGETVTLGTGGLAVFEGGERHEVRATADARLLLVLAPWPADGHGAVRSDASAEAGEL